jgi:hypothetical protein
LVALISACDTPMKMPPNPDGGPPLALEVIGQSQLGLHYNKAAMLEVSYHVDDPTQQPVVGQPVHFSIFGDPAGSTLSADRAVTDDSGVAQVTLTAGAAEATFKVTVSALNAPDTEFQVSVSKLDFVGLRVELAWSGSDASTLRALLYNNRSCAELAPAPAAPAALRSLSKSGTTVTLEFINLLSMNYAILGRAEDASGHLIGQGCVDLPSALVPAGSTVDVPLPLSQVLASPIGSYAISTSIDVAPASSGVATSPWHALTACPLGLAQALLDATSDALASDALKTAIAGQRAPASGSAACRPSMNGAATTLDSDLEALLTTTNAPATQLDAMVTALDGIVAKAQVASTLTVSAAGPDTLTGEHILDEIDTGLLPAGKFDPVAIGLPIVDVKDVPVSFDHGKLVIGAHGFTLRLPALWLATFESGVVGPKFPTLMPPTTRGWLGLAVGAVTHGGMSGCAGIEDLICQKTAAPSCSGNVAPACTTALDHLSGQLEAGFRTINGIDFTLSGQCTASDTDNDLLIDRLDSGTWTSPVAATATFGGGRL